jgi:hypothetical protein
MSGVLEIHRQQRIALQRARLNELIAQYAKGRPSPDLLDELDALARDCGVTIARVEKSVEAIQTVRQIERELPAMDRDKLRQNVADCRQKLADLDADTRRRELEYIAKRNKADEDSFQRQLEKWEATPPHRRGSRPFRVFKSEIDNTQAGIVHSRDEEREELVRALEAAEEAINDVTRKEERARIAALDIEV